MKNWPTSSKIVDYLKQRWFKVFLIGFLLYVFFNKDFSFSFNLNSPDQAVPAKEMPAGVPAKKGEKKKEALYTYKAADKEVAKSESSFFDRLRLPFIGREKAPARKSELAQIEAGIKEAYIHRFAHVAENEQQRFGIPASIIMANALVHSFAGQRDLAIEGNNHFGIPCTSDWTNQTGTYNGQCYRHYESAWSSFRNHSQYLSGERFAHLKKLDTRDYKGWAKGLERASYSEFSSLSKLLIKVIEEYRLHELDKV